jgi:hypothetical protein
MDDLLDGHALAVFGEGGGNGLDCLRLDGRREL